MLASLALYKTYNVTNCWKENVRLDLLKNGTRTVTLNALRYSVYHAT